MQRTSRWLAPWLAALAAAVAPAGALAGESHAEAHADGPAGTAPPRPGESAAALGTPRSRSVDVLDLQLLVRLALDVPPVEKTDKQGQGLKANPLIDGDATYTVRVERAGAVLVLDAEQLTLQTVEVDGQPAKDWQTDGHAVQVPLTTASVGSVHRVRLRWHAAPQRGLYVIRPDADAPKRPLHVWTQGETQEARHWLPCPDHPNERLTWTVTAVAPAGLTVLSNGREAALPAGLAVAAGQKATAFQLDVPTPIYLLTLVAGPFVAIEHPHPRVPLRTWALPDQVSDARRAYASTPAILDALEAVTGVPYPWGRYGHVLVQDFTAGGMENATLSTLTHRAVPDVRGLRDWDPDGLIAHELAHQWFGNWRTCASWGELWINEAFASYLDALVVEKRFGADKFYEELDDLRRSYLAESAEYQRPIVTPRYAAPDDLFDRHTYNKGALVAHQLRRKLGDQAFFAGIQRFLQAGPTSAETVDLRRALEHASTEDLGGFFARWLHEPGHPKLTATSSWQQDAGRWTLQIKQTASTGALFGLDIPVLVTTAAGTKQHLIALRGAEAALTLPERPLRWEVDPQLSVLAEWKLQAEPAELAAAATEGSTAEVRLQAVRALGEQLSSRTAVAALRTALERDRARHVRAEAARQLGNAARDDSAAALLRALGSDADARVREAAAAALGDQRDPATTAALVRALQQDGSDAVVRAALTALGKVDRAAARPLVLAALRRASHFDNVAAHALGVLGQIGTAADAATLQAALRPGAGRPRREAAALALATLAVREPTQREAARLALEAALHEPNHRLRGQAARGLAALSDPASRPALLAAASRELHGRLARQLRETADGLGQKLPAEERIKKLEAAVEQLQQRGKDPAKAP